MKLLESRVRAEGHALDERVLLVDSFLNHQVDPELMLEIGKEFARLFADEAVTRVVTVESSGIAPAAFTALYMGLPLVVLKKQTSRIMTGDLIQTTVRSFTKGTQYELTAKREFLIEGENVLLIDDFLASGEAAFGVLNLARQAGVNVGGIGIVIEKAFQPGRKRLEEAGIDVYSLARVKAMSENAIELMD